MSSRLRVLTKPIATKFSSSILRKRTSEVEEHQRLRCFAENLTHEIQHLQPDHDECTLRLKWLHGVVSLALKQHNQAVDLVPKIEFPLSKSDEAWMSEYLDGTTTVLEVCNSLRATMSSLEHGQLLTKYAICALEMHDTSLESTYLMRARKTLQDWIEVVQVGQLTTPLCSSETGDANVRLRRMVDGLNVSRERAPAKHKAFLEALSGARTTAILACTVLSIGLSGKSDLSIPKATPSDFGWSSCTNYLIQRTSSKACENIAKGCSGRAEEIEDVRAAVQKLVAVLEDTEFSRWIQDKDEMRAHVGELRRRSEILSRELEKVSTEVDELVRSIICSRTALLVNLRVPS